MGGLVIAGNPHLINPFLDATEIEVTGRDTGRIASATGYASHGESWSFALSLRLGSFELLRVDGSDPVLLLDDVFAELDRRRRGALARVAAGAEQVLITAAVPEDVPVELEARRIGVEATVTDGGRVSAIVASI